MCLKKYIFNETKNTVCNIIINSIETKETKQYSLCYYVFFMYTMQVTVNTFLN